MHSFPTLADQIPLLCSLQGGSSKVDVLVCTPGRLMDHLTGTRNFSLQHLRFLVCYLPFELTPYFTLSYCSVGDRRGRSPSRAVVSGVVGASTSFHPVQFKLRACDAYPWIPTNLRGVFGKILRSAPIPRCNYCNLSPTSSKLPDHSYGHR